MISVIIPVYNESDEILSTLEAFARQTYSGPFEIIVVDNNSIDGSDDCVREFSKANPEMSIRIIYETQQGIAAASQAGFTEARYPIIARTDADTTVNVDWLEVIAKRFSDPHVAALCGHVGFKDPNPLQKWLFFEFFIELHQRLHVLIKKPHFYGFNFAVRNEVFQRTSGFDIRLRLAEDLDLAIKIQESLSNDERIEYADDMRVFSSSRRYHPDEEWLEYTLTGYKSYFQRAWLGKVYPWMFMPVQPSEPVRPEPKKELTKSSVE